LFSAVTGLLTVAMVSTAVLAQMGFPPGPLPPGPPPPIAMLFAGLSLTMDQQSAIAAIMKSHQATLAPLMDQLHSEHQQLAAVLLSSGQVNLSDLTPLEEQSAKTEQQLQQETL